MTGDGCTRSCSRRCICWLAADWVTPGPAAGSKMFWIINSNKCSPATGGLIMWTIYAYPPYYHLCGSLRLVITIFEQKRFHLYYFCSLAVSSRLGRKNTQVALKATHIWFPLNAWSESANISSGIISIQVYSLFSVCCLTYALYKYGKMAGLDFPLSCFCRWSCTRYIQTAMWWRRHQTGSVVMRMTFTQNLPFI